MKYIFIVVTALFFISCTQAEETNSKKDTQRTEEKQTMTNEEFLKKFMEQEQRKQNAKDKTQALRKLNKTADELLETLNTDK